MKNNKAFTLIEIMISIAIISILSGLLLSVINIKGIKAKTRDSQRISDLEKVRTALELYFTDYRAYPVGSGSGWYGVSSLNSALVNGGYINGLPSDPVNSTLGAPCDASDTAYGYLYKSDATGTKYVLTSRMETMASADDSLCPNINNCKGGAISGCNCSLQTKCYGVENPF